MPATRRRAPACPPVRRPRGPRPPPSCPAGPRPRAYLRAAANAERPRSAAAASSAPTRSTAPSSSAGPASANAPFDVSAPLDGTTPPDSGVARRDWAPADGGAVRGGAGSADTPHLPVEDVVPRTLQVLRHV